MSKSDRFKRLVESREADTSNPQKPNVIEQIVGDFEQQNSSTKTVVNDTEQKSYSVINNSNNETTSRTLLNNTTQEQKNVTLLRNSSTEQLDATKITRTSNQTRIPKPIEEFEKKIKKPTIEQTHTRGTWLVRNDLLKRLNKLAKHQQRGFKTHLINYALERILDEIENK